jgi:pimeloyl-ACP methyl ester carboxylesterase
MLLAVFMLAGCSNHSYFGESEEALDTSGYYHILDHISNYYPSAIALNFPGYIIGLEETSSSLVTRGQEDVLLDEAKFEAGYTIKRLLKQLNYEVPFISQIMRYEGRPYGEGNCALYSLYRNHGTAIVDSCNDDPRNADLKNSGYESTFARSWDAIDILKERLAEDVSTHEYTHLIVSVMGLDTAQEEAIRNYKSLVSSIRKQAGSDFKPLFIGVTWPSFFANRWFDPLWEALAYPPIADRADILGLSWLGVLMDEVVKPLSDRLKVTVIAHSFGSRAASMAVCVGPALLRSNQSLVDLRGHGKIDNFIGLAPAFSLSRFEEIDGLFYENIFYRDYCPPVERFVFTASSNDGAFAPVFWSDSAGDHDNMEEYCERKHPVSVKCSAATPGGDIKGYDALARVNYIDTSELMRFTMPGTEGGGHSDIYRPEIGKLLWTLINRSAE